MVYLIHFEEKFKHCQHYIGYSKNQETFQIRIDCHKKGKGSSLMKAVTNAGIPWDVVRIWEDEDGNFERKLKNRKNSKGLCPICQLKHRKN